MVIFHLLHIMNSKAYGGIDMSIRPIDYQITVNKTGEFTKDANLIKMKPNIEQTQFSEELQKKKIQEEAKVNSTTETEYNRIDGNKQEKNTSSRQHQGHRRKKEKASTKKSKKTMKFKNNSNIDIKI